MIREHCIAELLWSRWRLVLRFIVLSCCVSRMPLTRMSCFLSVAACSVAWLVVILVFCVLLDPLFTCLMNHWEKHLTVSHSGCGFVCFFCQILLHIFWNSFLLVHMHLGFSKNNLTHCYEIFFFLFPLQYSLFWRLHDQIVTPVVLRWVFTWCIFFLSHYFSFNILMLFFRVF